MHTGCATVLVSTGQMQSLRVGLLMDQKMEFYCVPELCMVLGVPKQRLSKLLSRMTRPCRQAATAAQITLLSQKGHLNHKTAKTTLVSKATAAQLAAMLGKPQVSAHIIAVGPTPPSKPAAACVSVVHSQLLGLHVL